MNFFQMLQLFERISTLDNSNWLSWKFKFEAALRHVGLWFLVGNEVDFKKNPFFIPMDQNARTIIGLWVDDSLVPIIRDCSNAHRMWRALTLHFERQPKRNQIKRKQKNSTNETNVVDNEERQSDDDSKSLNIEELEDLTQPNFVINDFALYPILKEFGADFLSKVDQFYISPDGHLVVLITKEKIIHLFSTMFDENKINFQVPIEPLDLKDSNIKSFACGYDHYMILLDNGTLYSMGIGITVQAMGIKNISTMAPIKIMDCIIKVCCGYSHTLLLDYYGVTWLLGTNPYDQSTNSMLRTAIPMKVNRFYLHNRKIKDIACCLFGSIALADNGKIFIWGKFDLFKCLYPLDIKFKPNNVRSISGGRDTFTVLTTEGQIFWCHVDRHAKFQKQLLLIEEPIEACYECSIYEDIFLLVSITGSCYVWNGKYQKIIRPITNSIPDCISLYSMANTPNRCPTILTEKIVADFFNEKTPLNDPKNPAFELFFKHFEQKRIFAQKCSHFPQSQHFVNNDSFTANYYFMRYIHTKCTPITREIISKALQLLTEYQTQTRNSTNNAKWQHNENEI